MRAALTACLLVLLALPAAAQFRGPGPDSRPSTVAEAEEIRLGRYVTLTGNIVSHLREDYYLFRDETGEIRVEVSPRLWAGREVTPETSVRLLGEVDRGPFGRYVWVQTLDILP